MSALTLTDAASDAEPAAERGKADACASPRSVSSRSALFRIIYWARSRSFIHAPSKLDSNIASWMVNKFQLAMPGALLGTDHIVAAHQRRLENWSSRCMRSGAPFQRPLTFFH